eukprot:TRINITY_DN1023_c0_g1_i1.p1 TRINITY_DN1023_c0_g1~~TRINITY_DN1023_c0_g1_i1.p1  ORF type:complete len:365 (+),score=56.12 TRINITY_DN1023_c0_g1_i1:208-1302(+)
MVNHIWTKFIRLNNRQFSLVCIIIIVVYMVSSITLTSQKKSPSVELYDTTSYARTLRYRYQQTYLKYTNESSQYKLALIADRDKASKNGNTWSSMLVRAILTRDRNNMYSVDFRDSTVLSSSLNEGGRGMELSELVYFDHRLLTIDDRTGLVFEIEDSNAIPLYILMDGNGRTMKGFKGEWMSVKDDLLYIGSLGKEWTDQEGRVLGNNPQWVKTIDREGRILHHDWKDVYEKIRRATGYSYPGYILHEAVRWNSLERRWYFLPRRASKLPYDDTLDETRCTNLIISMDESFSDIQSKTIGEIVPTHGYSSFIFLPYRENEIVALKSEEHDQVATYMTVFNLNGDILMEETVVGEVKYEGIEIL